MIYHELLSFTVGGSGAGLGNSWEKEVILPVLHLRYGVKECFIVFAKKALQETGERRTFATAVKQLKFLLSHFTSSESFKDHCKMHLQFSNLVSLEATLLVLF